MAKTIDPALAERLRRESDRPRTTPTPPAPRAGGQTARRRTPSDFAAKKRLRSKESARPSPLKSDNAM